MKFGATLKKSIYQPWQDKYVDYDKLKKLLREDDDKPWTSEDVTKFTSELASVELDKVYTFKQDTAQKLRERTTACEKKLEPLAVGIKSEETKDGAASSAGDKDASKQDLKPEERERLLKEVLSELDGITKEVKELENYGRINYTAIIKATKKHDKLRGRSYRLRPFINARLNEKPIHTEDQSPLLYRLSAMYSFVRQNLDGKPKEALSFAESASGGEDFTSHKCMARLLQPYTHANMTQFGSTKITSSKSRPSSCAVYPSSYTIPKPRKSPKAPNAIPPLPRSILITMTSRCTPTRSNMSQTLHHSGCGGTDNSPRSLTSSWRKRSLRMEMRARSSALPSRTSTFSHSSRAHITWRRALKRWNLVDRRPRLRSQSSRRL